MTWLSLREIEATPVKWESACLVRPESIEGALVKLLVDGSKNYIRRQSFWRISARNISNGKCDH